MSHTEVNQKTEIPVVLAEDEKPVFTVLGSMKDLTYGVGSRLADLGGKFFG